MLPILILLALALVLGFGALAVLVATGRRTHALLLDEAARSGRRLAELNNERVAHAKTLQREETLRNALGDWRRGTAAEGLVHVPDAPGGDDSGPPSSTRQGRAEAEARRLPYHRGAPAPVVPSGPSEAWGPADHSYGGPADHSWGGPADSYRVQSCGVPQLRHPADERAEGPTVVGLNPLRARL